MQPDDPVALKVQWLEDSLLVHGVTVEETRARPATHLLLLGAMLGAAGAAAAVLVGSTPAALAAALVWVGCGLALGHRAWQTSHATPLPPRRLLVELEPGRVAWTLLAGDRWSMRHDHDLPMEGILGATAVHTTAGAAVRIALRDGGAAEIPLYGMPDGDARWLADRIADLWAAPPE